MNARCKICGLPSLYTEERMNCLTASFGGIKTWSDIPNAGLSLCETHFEKASRHHVRKHGWYYGDIEHKVTNEDIAAYICSILEGQVKKKAKGEVLGFCQALIGNQHHLPCSNYAQKEFEGKRVCNRHYRMLKTNKFVKLMDHHPPLLDMIYQYLGIK